MAKHRGPKLAPKYEEMPNIRRPFSKDKYLLCPKHEYVFVEGATCPGCEKATRSILDDWQPSQDQQDVQDDYGQAVTLSMAAAAAEQKIPKEGTYKLARCPLHHQVYVEGLDECPDCKCWAC
jgi:hypothetical protein